MGMHRIDRVVEQRPLRETGTFRRAGCAGCIGDQNHIVVRTAATVVPPAPPGARCSTRRRRSPPPRATSPARCASAPTATSESLAPCSSPAAPLRGPPLGDPKSTGATLDVTSPASSAVHVLRSGRSRLSDLGVHMLRSRRSRRPIWVFTWPRSERSRPRDPGVHVRAKSARRQPSTP